MKKIKLFITAIAFLTLNFGIGILNCQAQITNLYDFDSINGYQPRGNLYSDGTYLYGTTDSGGVNNYGVIFKIKPDGTGFTKLHNFTLAGGCYPYSGTLVSDGTYLYGMTNQGGLYNYGNIFKIKPDGTSFASVLDFDGTNGSQAFGDLIYDGNFLYGMTAAGGLNSFGNIFKIKPDGTGFVNLLDFDLSNGYAPFGSLISDGTFLYGMSSGGGYGNIIKIKLDGSGFVDLKDFNGTDGNMPYGDLISDGTFLYGMTSAGGVNGNGNIFKIKPDGTGFVDLLDFNGANGNSPFGSLILQGGFLYGMTLVAGADSLGNIFKIKPDGTGFVNLLTFNGSNGAAPYDSFISDGTYLYGMTAVAGNGYGNIFKYCIASCPTATTYTISVSSGSTIGGSVSGGATLNSGATATVIATANTHYQFVNWTESGNVVSTSPTYSFTVTGNRTLVARFDIIMGITNIEDNNFINVYPNPTSSIINIELEQTEKTQIKITDVLDNAIYQSNSTASNVQIDLSSQANGVYFIIIQTNEGIVNKKIVISK